jgi:hypothetical protein
VQCFGGLVFIYMGPPERIPVFPLYDRYHVPGLAHVAGGRWPVECNWLQIKENAVDPYHTNVLHVIPQRRGMAHFADEFGAEPETTWTETPGGVAYLAARHVGDNVWVRSAEILGANLHIINSVFETGRERKPASLPFMSIWTLPVDDEHSIGFYISHIAPDEAMPFEKRRALEMLGQTDDRPYRDRQLIPGDYDAQGSQGPINPHALEQLGYQDRGVVLYRRFVRRGIEAVARGQDPQGYYASAAAVPPTFANDRVVPASEVGGNPDDPAVLRQFCEKVARDYLAAAPMAALMPNATE